MTWQSVFATGDNPGEQGRNHCPLRPRLRNCIQYCHFRSFLLVTQVNSVHCVRGLMRVWKGNKDYWELFGSPLHNPPLAPSDSCSCLMQRSSDPLPNSSWVSPHYSSSLKSWIASPYWGPGMSEVPGVQLLKYDSSPLQTWELETGYPFPSTNPRYGGIGLG